MYPSYTEHRPASATVVGIGRSNIPLAAFLTADGVRVTARDKKERSQLGEAADRLEEMGVALICGERYLDNITEEWIFRAPAVRFDKPEFIEAQKRGSYLTSEMALFFELCPATIVGITGSDGKTTTTTLISLFLQAEVKKRGRGAVYLGGNIGKPLLPDVRRMTKDDFAVVELSSFQLHTMRRSPDVSVVTNVTPNHLDYHLGMKEYIAAKKNIYLHQKPSSTVILNAKNDVTRAMAEDAPANVLFFNTDDGTGMHEENGVLCLGDRPMLKVSDILLPGRHNVENYMAAIAAYDAAVGHTADPALIREIAASFPGVEHRLEFVREKDGVRYYNGSIDSSPTRTLAALSAFRQKVIVICGGYDKHIPYEPLAPGLCEHAKTVVLTGATGPKIDAALAAYVAGNRVASPAVLRAPDFDSAVAMAHDAAAPGDIVLLSPASASFDAFRDFEERGRHFKELVNKL